MNDQPLTVDETPMGKTTVVIMSHNYGRYLGQAIDSVLSQTRRAAQIVVVDDASDDDTPSVMRPYLEKVQFHRVEYRSQQRTRNFGLAQATTEYVLFLDADDCMAAEMLQRLEDALDARPEARLAYCDKHVFGNEAAMTRLNLAARWSAGDFSVERLRFKNFVMATSLLRRDSIKSFDERIVRLTDWDTWLGMLHEDAHAAYVPEPLLHYRVHGENVSIRRRELIERLKILVKHGLVKREGTHQRTRSAHGTKRRHRVVLLAMSRESPDIRPWLDLSHRHRWDVRAIVGVPHADNSITTTGQRISRHGPVVLQETASSDIEDLFRRYISVVTDPLVDAIIVTDAPQSVQRDASLFETGEYALRCNLAIDDLLSTVSLEQLGTFAISPAAVRLLLYVPPAPRMTPVERLRRAASGLFAQHVSWRFKRTPTPASTQD